MSWTPLVTLGDVAAYSDETVQPGTAYEYRIIALDGATESAPSEIASATTPDTLAVTFAGTVPAQTLSASLTRSVPEYAATYAGNIPAQTLAVSLTRTVPGFAATFAGDVPAQVLDAAIVATPPAENSPPDVPSITSATQQPDGSVVLTSSAFSDPDPGDTHARSRWRVYAVGG